MNEATKRDEALAALRETRADLIVEAGLIALDLAQRHGRVTSVEVLREMRRRANAGAGYGQALDASDPRFLGVVFRHRRWARIGYEPIGSHCRPVSVWRLR